MQILFEKLYGTYLGGTTQMCFIQYLKQDLHILCTNILCIYEIKLNKMNFYDLKSLFTVTKGNNIRNNKFNKENE